MLHMGTLMNNKLAVYATAFSLVFGSAHAASDIFVDQLGQNLLPLSSNQMVSIEDVSDVATGAANSMRSIRSQFGNTTPSASLLVQNGDDNRADFHQTGAGNLGIVMQTGMMNNVNLLQQGSGNSAMVLQSGYRNMASVSQMGNNHSAFVAQQGIGNVAIISQR